MSVWGHLDVADISSKYADDFIVLETKQQILEAIQNTPSDVINFKNSSFNEEHSSVEVPTPTAQKDIIIKYENIQDEIMQKAFEFKKKE